MFYFFFFKSRKQQILKKSAGQNFVILFFCFCLKLGRLGPQTNKLTWSRLSSFSFLTCSSWFVCHNPSNITGWNIPRLLSLGRGCRCAVGVGLVGVVVSLDLPFCFHKPLFSMLVYYFVRRQLRSSFAFYHAIRVFIFCCVIL